MADVAASGYQVLPGVYDRWQQTYGRDFTAIILPRLLASVKKYHIPTSTFLDVGCGTGTLVLEMARRGWKVWGIDASEGMIREAERKRDEQQLEASFLRQDMRMLEVPRRVRLVTSMFDALNHVGSNEELLMTFRGIRRVLLSSGYFMFDMNNQECYRTLWQQREVIKHQDFTLVLENSFDDRSGRARSEVTLTPKSGGEPLTEVVEEQLFLPEEVRVLLDKAGFAVCLCEDFAFPDVPEAGRIKTWWVANPTRRGPSASSGSCPA